MNISDNIRISIVTISFNQAEWLKYCLDSVNCQEYANLQHIVIDGGSTDGSVDILEKYSKKKLCYQLIWESSPDDGPADALNKGFAKADGDCYGFLNSDDMLYPGALHVVAEHFKNNSIKVIQGAGLIMDERSRLIRPVPSIPLSISSFLAHKHVIFQPSVFFRNEVFGAVGGFNSKNYTSWDAEFFVDCCLAGYLIHPCHYVLSLFRLYSNSKSGSGCDSIKIVKDRDRMRGKCVLFGAIPEKNHLKRKVFGWVMSLPSITFASYAWARMYGIKRN